MFSAGSREGLRSPRVSWQVSKGSRVADGCQDKREEAASAARSERLIVTPALGGKVETLPFVTHHPIIEPGPAPSGTRR